jgi:hypothetical protein
MGAKTLNLRKRGKLNMKRFLQKIFNWEKWPYDIIYLPIDIVWLWYGIKARAFWFFSPVNPTLEFSGFEGNSKKQMYDQLPTWCYPATLFVSVSNTIENIKINLQQAGLHFPIVAKPDTGMQGVLFRILKNEEELKAYHEKVGEDYILQTFVDDPLEFSVFYIRYPGKEKGMITGLIVKDYLHVTGEGNKTLAELVAAHPTAKFQLEKMKKKHAENWLKLIPAHEKYYLSMAGNHIHGAKFLNLNHEIDEQLCAVFDKISHESTGELYFGRYDLKCTSLEDLKNGKNIKVLEYNGAGAAITHVFDRNMSYGNALKEIVRHWRFLYEIGKINHQKGVPYWSFMKGYRHMQKAKKNYRRMRAIDKSWM